MPRAVTCFAAIIVVEQNAQANSTTIMRDENDMKECSIGEATYESKL